MSFYFRNADPAQRTAFESNGYLIVEDALPPELVRAMCVEAQGMAREEKPDVTRRTWHERA